MPGTNRKVTITELSILDVLQTPIWVFDIQHTRMWWANVAALRLWNARDRTALCARDFSDLSDSSRQRLDRYLELFQRGERQTERWTFYPEGVSQTVECICSGVEIDDGRLAMLVEGRSLSPEEISQAELRGLEAMRHTAVMISLYTWDGQVLLRNPSASRALGVPGGREPVETNDAFASTFATAGDAAWIRGTVAGGQVFSGELRIQTRDGVRWHGLDVRRVPDPVSASPCLLVNQRDINRLKELEGELRGLVSFASHELRGPLTLIDAGVQRLLRRDGCLQDAEARGRLEGIRSTVGRMSSLIGRVLTISRAAEGRLPFHPVEGDLGALLAELCEHQRESSALRIDLNLDGLDRRFIFDPALLEHVLANLLNNAVKYSPGGVRIEVRARREGDEVVVAIRDFGVGIPQKELPYLFERFFRASSSAGIEGTGLGLSLVKELVAMHGGRIVVESRLGEGSTFTVRLPMRTPSVGSGSVETWSEAAAGQGH